MNNAKNTFQFTLILNNTDKYMAKLEGNLYQAGCNDALINIKDGAVYLDFDRSAFSLKGAIVSAIKQVESSLPGAIVGGVMLNNL